MEQPNFYAVIPSYVRYDKELSSTAKLIYAEITVLTNKQGYCFAGNKYFMELYGLSMRSLSRILTQLGNKGYIRIENGKSAERKIYISDAATWTKMSNRIDKNVHVDIDKNVQQNNTSNNNIKNTKSYTDDFENWYAAYPNRWNKQQTFRNYTAALKTHTADELIKARDAYTAHIQKNGTPQEYITRSTNFLGRKGEYIGWLESAGEHRESAETAVKDDCETAELIRRRKEMLGL